MTEIPDSSVHSSRPRRLLTWPRLLFGIVWAVSLVAAWNAGIFLMEHETAIMRRLGRMPISGTWQTSLHAVSWQRVPIFEDGRYGAIAPLAGGVLYSTRSGRLFFADSTRALHELALEVPINIAEFETDPFNATTVDKDLFAVKDLLTQVTPSGVRIVAAHHQWDTVNKCDWLRISMTEVRLDRLLAGASAEWSTLYDTRPCMPLGLRGAGVHTPTIGAGSRLVQLSDHELLFSVGTFISDVVSLDDPSVYTDPSIDYDYGRTFVLDLNTGAKRTFTRGHRNPQGLAIAPDGRIWETEHAAMGGDELNLLAEGKDYGYPFVSYGTMYGLMYWPLAKKTGMHEGYEKPAFVWVPSIGVSQLVTYSGRLFDRWKDDLIVASLGARSLFRVRVEDGTVRYIEPIPTGHRTRDIVEVANGEVVLLAEDGFLVYLKPISFDGEDPTLIPRELGQLVANRCLGCHSFERGATDGIGPSLYGIVDRRIASMRGFTYSDALEVRGGRWTEQNLRAYLANPTSFIPGTSMELPFQLSPRDIDHLLAYLRTLD
jgi:cytochrome c2